MADRIVVLRGGVIEQVGAPLDLYNEPKNKFVAGFIGSPRMNFVSGFVARVTDTEFDVESVGYGKLTLPRGGRDLRLSQRVSLGVRPEDIEPVDAGDQAWTAVVDVSEQHGSSTYLHCGAPVSVDDKVGDGNEALLLHIPGQSLHRSGQQLRVRPTAGHWHVFDEQGLRIVAQAAGSSARERATHVTEPAEALA